MCLKDPGFGIDLVVAADLAALTPASGSVMSRSSRPCAHERFASKGSRDLVRAFPGWLLLSHFAGVARPRPARAS